MNCIQANLQQIEAVYPGKMVSNRTWLRPIYGVHPVLITLEGTVVGSMNLVIVRTISVFRKFRDSSHPVGTQVHFFITLPT